MKHALGSLMVALVLAARLVAATVIPATPAPQPLGPPAPRADGGLVWEAEWPSTLTGSYEPLPWTGAAGGFAMLTREGSGRPRPEVPVTGHGWPWAMGELSCYLEVPAEATYTLWVRAWAQDGCGDSCYVSFDDQPPARFPERIPTWRYPYLDGAHLDTWHWVRDPGRQERLTAGPHLLRLAVREDGYHLDPFALLPAGTAPPDLAAPLANSYAPPVRGPLAARLVLASHVVPAPGTPLAGWLWLQQGRGDARPPALRLNGVPVLDPAPGLAPGQRLVLPFSLAWDASPPLGTTPLLATLADGTVLAAERLVNPLTWDLLGPVPLDSLAHDPLAAAPQTLDLHASPWPGVAWRGLPAATAYRFTGTLDLQAALGPQRDCVAYLTTRLHAAQPGTYALLAGGDDALQLWLDGQLLHRDDADGPFFDHLRLLPVTLAAGPHTVLVRLTQRTGYWQLHLEPRAADGAPTPHLTGLPPSP